MPKILVAPILLTTVALLTPTAIAHPGHAVDADQYTRSASFGPLPIVLAQQPTPNVTGQGNLRFRLLHTRGLLPVEALAVLERAHGGFAVDRRSDRGEVYFALPGAGIIQLSRDLRTARLLDTHPAMKDLNMHNTTLWFAHDGAPRLAFPANDAGKVFTTTLDGALEHTLDAPTDPTIFASQPVRDYFGQGGKFVPTDVEYLNGLFYITTGYSPLDYVLTARLNPAPQWGPLAFGGRGDGPGQFGTGHGVTVAPGLDRLDIADRPNSEIDRYRPDGTYVGALALPKGSFPCDIDYAEGYAVVGCLYGPDRSKGAPIYILKDDAIVSTLMPKEDLGLEKFQHVHNAVLLRLDGKLYVIAQAWNPGDFAILEQVTD